jgi:DNA-binding NarL/FixJ family response regulator
MLTDSELRERARAREQYAEFMARVRVFRQSVEMFRRDVVRHRQPVLPLIQEQARRGSPLRVSDSPAPQRLSDSPAPQLPSEPRRSPLTARQHEVARLIARGYSNQHIADALVLTPGTVANHVQHILERLDVHSRAQIAVWFTRRGARD